MAYHRKGSKNQKYSFQEQRIFLALEKEKFANQASAFNTIITAAAKHLLVKRVSIWLFNETKSNIKSQALYDQGDLSNTERVLESKDYPHYFRALNHSGVITADNAQTCSSTNEFTTDYLIPLGITSMMDIPIWIKGEVIGIVCYEHIGQIRQWGAKEANFGFYISDYVAKVLLENTREQAEIRLQVSEESIRFSQQQLENVIQGAQLGYWDWHYQTGEHEVNDRWLEMLGLSRNQVKNHVADWKSLIHPEDQAWLLNIVETHIDSGKAYEAEFRMRHTDGHWVWIQGSGAVVEYNPETKQPMRICGTHQDISARKQAEFELYHYKNTLESLVEERTEALNIALQASEGDSQSKTEFLSSMSHELRTPLNAILGFAQLLQANDEEPLTEEQEEGVEYILSSGTQLLNLINDVLDLSDIEAGNIRVTFEAINIMDLIEQVVNLMNVIAEKEAIQLNILSDMPAVVLGDDRKIKQVIINLLDNAIKYNEVNGTVNITWQYMSHERLRINICDTGVGIKEANHERIFSPFHRLDKEKCTTTGTGVGLTVSKKLMELMGGNIGVESIEHEGSTFWIELPLFKESDKEANTMNQFTILVVEDEEAIRQMLVIVLQQNNFTVLEAGDVAQAQSLLNEHLPDLILLDWMLPKITGDEWTRRLKSDTNYSDVPIILLTAKGEESDKIRGLDLGADDYVTKPFSPKELVSRIKAVLRRSGKIHDLTQIKFQDITLNTEQHSVNIGGEEMEVSPTEFKLLKFFLTHPGKVYTRTQLLDKVWGHSVYIEERTIDVHIRRLRKILAQFQREDWLQTVRGFGYRFSEKKL